MTEARADNRTSIIIRGKLLDHWREELAAAQNLPTAQWLLLYGRALNATATAAYEARPVLCEPNVSASATMASTGKPVTSIRVLHLAPSVSGKAERLGGVAETLRTLEGILRMAGSAAIDALQVKPNGTRDFHPDAIDYVWAQKPGPQQTISRASLKVETPVRAEAVASHGLTYQTEGSIGIHRRLPIVGSGSVGIGHELTASSVTLWADGEGSYTLDGGSRRPMTPDAFKALGQFTNVAALVAGDVHGGRSPVFAE